MAKKRKVTSWKFDEKRGVFVHPLFSEHEESLGDDKEGDVISRMAYDPSHSRMFNSFEVAQIMRFQISLNWMRLHFQDLERKEGEKRRKTVTDFGCSRSYIYQYWKYRANYFGWPLLRYQGIDSNLSRLIDGMKLVKKKKNDIVKHYLADLSRKMILSDKADVAICLEVMEHLSPEAVNTLLYNIRQNLRKDGIAIISSPNPKSFGEWVWGDGSRKSHHKEYPWKEAKKILEKSKFEILDYTGVLPGRDYRNKTSFKDLRSRLSQLISPALVNNILILAEDNISLANQWICKVKKV